MLLAAHAMNKIETLYGTIFEDILGEKISTKPVEVVTPFPWVNAEGRKDQRTETAGSASPLTRAATVRSARTPSLTRRGQRPLLRQLRRQPPVDAQRPRQQLDLQVVYAVLRQTEKLAVEVDDQRRLGMQRRPAAAAHADEGMVVSQALGRHLRHEHQQIPARFAAPPWT